MTDPSREAFERAYPAAAADWHDGIQDYVAFAAHYEGWQAAMAHKEVERWRPIETAPRDKTVLLGYRNSHGHWRTLRGEWFSLEEIYDHWEDPEGVDAGWFEMSVEADDVPNVWRTNPTHWMPLPAAPLNTTTKPA